MLDEGKTIAAVGDRRGGVAGLVQRDDIAPVSRDAIVATECATDTRGGAFDVFDPVAYAARLPVIATSYVLALSVPTVRAARIDPSAILRKD